MHYSSIIVQFFQGIDYQFLVWKNKSQLNPWNNEVHVLSTCACFNTCNSTTLVHYQRKLSKHKDAICRETWVSQIISFNWFCHLLESITTETHILTTALGPRCGCEPFWRQRSVCFSCSTASLHLELKWWTHGRTSRADITGSPKLSSRLYVQWMEDVAACNVVDNTFSCYSVSAASGQAAGHVRRVWLVWQDRITSTYNQLHNSDRLSLMSDICGFLLLNSLSLTLSEVSEHEGHPDLLSITVPTY